MRVASLNGSNRCIAVSLSKISEFPLRAHLKLADQEFIASLA